METKICTKCGRDLPITDFYFRDKARGRRRSECKYCHNQYVKERYEARRKKIEKIKADKQCAKCGENRGYVLDFHHLDPKEKEIGIAQMIAHNAKMDNLEKEMNKCICLCANCHREFHFFNKRDGITIKDYLGV